MTVQVYHEAVWLNGNEYRLMRPFQRKALKQLAIASALVRGLAPVDMGAPLRFDTDPRPRRGFWTWAARAAGAKEPR